VTRRFSIIVALLALVVAAETAYAQRGRFLEFEPRLPIPPVAPPNTYDANFRFCRLRFHTSAYGDGNGWWVDYPRADINLSLRVAETTRVPVARQPNGNPAYAVVNATDDELMQCPFVMMTEPGGADFDDAEVARLREYLQKGGFLWADDFWGSAAWTWFATQLARVLPPDQYPIVDLPADHPLFHTMFDIAGVPQIPNVGLWVTSHLTSERGADSAEAHGRAILDEKGRVMVFMTFNTDFGDAYERESESADYFARFSVNAYAIGVNIVLYAMTH
jgi:hypothetical protein